MRSACSHAKSNSPGVWSRERRDDDRPVSPSVPVTYPCLRQKVVVCVGQVRPRRVRRDGGAWPPPPPPPSLALTRGPEFCRTHDFAAQRLRCSTVRAHTGQGKPMTNPNSVETSTRRHAFVGYLHMVALRRQKGARNFGCSRDGSPPINGA